MCVSYQPVISSHTDACINRNLIAVVPSQKYMQEDDRNVTLDMLFNNVAAQCRTLFFEGGRLLCLGNA